MCQMIECNSYEKPKDYAVVEIPLLVMRNKDIVVHISCHAFSGKQLYNSAANMPSK